MARELEWSKPWSTCSSGSRRTRSGSSAASSTRRVNCLDRHVAARARNKAALIWEGEPGDRARSRTGTSTRGQQVRERARVARREARRPRRDLPADDSRGRDRDARLRAHRRDRTRWCSAGSRRSRCATGSTTRSARCSSPPTAAIGAARSCRSSATPTRRSRRRRRSSTWSSCSAAPATASDEAFAEMQEGRDHWWHRLMHDARAVLRARADGRRGRAVHPLHLAARRQAEGHRAHHRRLPRPARTRPRSWCSTSRTTTSSGAPPTSAGSPGTPMSCTARSPTARRA